MADYASLILRPGHEAAAHPWAHDAQLLGLEPEHRHQGGVGGVRRLVRQPARHAARRLARNGDEVVALQSEVEQIHVDDTLMDYALEVVRKTRDSEFFALGVSPRGSLMLYRAAQAMAFLCGRTFCTPEDFKPLVVPVFAHRVVLNAMLRSGSKAMKSNIVFGKADP